jgi:beta-lactamase superfamily II metal-dependent hydrolase
MANKAQEIIIPPQGVYRTVFLYVGQGTSVLMAIPDGMGHKFALIDTNNDKVNEGIEVSRLLEDLLGKSSLDIFINTHPHDDHLAGIQTIHNVVGIKEVWHSGHKPGKDHNDAFKEMEKVIKDIGKENEYVLFGTNDKNKIRESDKETEVIKRIGDIDFQVLSPAEYVADDVQDEKPETRYQRIHEHCTVIRFSYGNAVQKRYILIPGDSDKTAWKDHITDYHKDNLLADVLSGSHHGSRTFFKNDEDDEDVYEKHIKNIKPKHLIISAPKQSESKHEHPHDDAIELYEKHVNKDNIYHQGENRECVIVDIKSDGSMSVKLDSTLVKEYKFKDDNEGKNESKNYVNIGVATTRLDSKPMG